MLKRTIRYTLISLLLIYLLILAEIFCYSLQTTEQSAEAVVVAGAVVWGSRPSPVFVERINHAVALYHAGQVKYLIFTGGRSEGDRLSEANAARRYAIQHGVRAEHILTESVSTNSYENLREAKKIIEREGFRQVLLSSDPMHMKRLMDIADDLQINALPSPTQTSRYRSLQTIVPFLLREGIYLILYHLLPTYD